MKNQYARVFAIINQLNAQGAAVTKEDLVFDFTGGKHCSLSALSFQEFKEFERQIVNISPNKYTSTDYVNDKNDKLRKAIIAIFKSIGRTVDDCKAWAENYGVNGQKKPFNNYNTKELWLLRRNAEKVKRDFIKAAAKKL